MENKYHNSKIYAVKNTINDEIYIGSTTIALSRRMVKHRCDAKQRPELSHFYTYMNEQGIENFYIELVEKVKCEDIEELRKREGELIKEMGTLNQRVAGRTNKETTKIWSSSNRDRINEKRRERRRENPEKTKEDVQKHSKTHRERHKEELKAKASVKHDCPCGGKYTEGHKHEHMNSKRHLKYLGTFNEEEYKNSKRCEELKNRYEKNKDNIDKEKMKEYNKSWYENKKKQYEQSLN